MNIQRKLLALFCICFIWIVFLLITNLTSVYITVRIIDAQWQQYEQMRQEQTANDLEQAADDLEHCQTFCEERRQEAFYSGVYWVCFVQNGDPYPCLLVVREAYQVNLIEDMIKGWSWAFVKGESEG